jgi:hypothetical protein
MHEEPVMTNHQPPEHDTQHEDGASDASRGHSLAGAALCLGIGAAIALIAILG